MRLHHIHLVGLLLCFSQALPAVSGTSAPALQEVRAQNLMQEGISAFNAGDLQRARALLERALVNDTESLTLRYNLGVLYYRLGLYKLSRESFLVLLNTPHDDLARYNLGLVTQAEGGRDQEARAWFRQVAASARQEKLRQLAQYQLDRPQASNVPVSSPWLGIASVAGGYEINPALLADDIVSDRSDGFSEGLVAVQGPLFSYKGREEQARSVNVSASIFSRHYHSGSGHDSAAVQMGVAWATAHALGRLQFALEQSYFRSAGESREFHTSLEVRYWRDSCGRGAGSGCELFVRASRISSFDQYEAYGGMRYLAGARYRYYHDNWRVSGRLNLEFNNREDLALSEGQFFSLSPRRQELVLGADYLGWQPCILGAELGYRYSDYPDHYQVAPGSEWTSGRRADHQYTAILSADYALSEAWNVRGLINHRANRSSLKQYHYDNQVYQVGLDYLF